MSEQCRDHGSDESPWMCQCTREALDSQTRTCAGCKHEQDGGSVCWNCRRNPYNQQDKWTPNAEAHGRRSRTVQPLVGNSEGGQDGR
jgi:hypothetical protein